MDAIGECKKLSNGRLGFKKRTGEKEEGESERALGTWEFGLGVFLEWLKIWSVKTVSGNNRSGPDSEFIY